MGPRVGLPAAGGVGSFHRHWRMSGKRCLNWILLDLGLPSDIDGASEGLAILRETLHLNPMAKVIVVTGNSDRAKAVAAIESGAYDFIEKPVQLEVLEDRASSARHTSPT